MKPLLTRVLLSGSTAKALRVWTDVTSPRRLTLYYQPGDPYSLLCAQWLRRALPRLRVPVTIRVVPPPDDEAYPQRSAQRVYAVLDAQRVAPAYGCEFAWECAPDPAAEAQAAAALADDDSSTEAWLEREAHICARLWAGQALNVAAPTDAAVKLHAHHAERKRRGHYLGGMWWFRGEWFWGVDRLGFLEAALRAVDGVEGELPLWTFDAKRLALPAPHDDPMVDFFFSFRSPYSYLALAPLRELLERYRFRLRVRPVLPMVMRGLRVPAVKRRYIVRDVKRLAIDLELPFGQIADPLGAGVERCLAVFPHEADSREQLAYLSAAATAIWAEGIDVASDAGLRYVVERAQMSWGEVKKRLSCPHDLAYAEINSDAMTALGAWGVPTLSTGSLLLWGQDRLPLLEEWLQRGESCSCLRIKK